MWSLEVSRAKVNSLQVQVIGRKRAFSVGADFAVGEHHRTAVVEKNDRRALRPRTTTSRVESGVGTRPCGERESHRRGIEPEVIVRPIASLERRAMPAYRLFWGDEHTGDGEG